MPIYTAFTTDFNDKGTWKHKEIVSDSLPFPEKPNAENIAKKWISVIEDFKLTGKIHVAVRHNDANIIKATNEAGFDQLDVFCTPFI